MIVLALLLVAQAAPAESSDVTVIAQRLDRFRAQVAFGKTGPQCRIKVSTGDAEIDRIGCAAIEICYPPFDSRMAATRDRAIKPATRKVMQGALNDELRACFDGQTKGGIDALAAKRAKAL